MCRLLQVSTSGFYDWQGRPLSAHARQDVELTALIHGIYERSHRTYGARRVHAELREAYAVRVGRKRVARLMRRAGLKGVQKRRLLCTTRSGRAERWVADLVDRQFVADRPDALWVVAVKDFLDSGLMVTRSLDSSGREFLAALVERSARCRRRLEAVALDHPLAVVELRPGDEREPQILDGREGLHPQQLLLERADHPLCAAIALGRTYERWARFDTEEREFVLERIAQVLTAVIVTHGEPAGDVGFDQPEATADPLAQRLQCLVARRALGGVHADEFRGRVIDRDKHG